MAKQHPGEFGWANTFLVTGVTFAVSAGLWFVMSLHHGLTASSYWSAVAFGAVIGLPMLWFTRPDRYQHLGENHSIGWRRLAQRGTTTVWWIVLMGGFWLVLNAADGLHASSFVWALVYAVIVVTANWWGSRREDRRLGKTMSLSGRPRIVAKSR